MVQIFVFLFQNAIFQILRVQWHWSCATLESNLKNLVFFSKEKKVLFYFYAIIDGWARHISWWWKRCAKIWSFQICKWNCLKWWSAKSTQHFLINSCNFSKMLQKQKSKFMAAKKSWFWKRNAFIIFAHSALLSFTDQISEFHKI